jgi:hypothetical protein
MANKNGSSKRKTDKLPFDPTVIFLWMGGHCTVTCTAKDEQELLAKIARFEFGDGEVIDGDYEMPCTNSVVLSDITVCYYAPGSLKQTKLVLKKGTKKAR